MIGPLCAASFTVLTLSLAVPTASLTAQEPLEPFAAYNDWSVYVLQAGELRVCYAETKLVSTNGAGGRFGDMRLQVTSRSLSGSSEMIRLTTVPESYGEELYVNIGSVDTFRVYDLYFSERGSPHTRWHASVIENMKAAEATTAGIVLQRKHSDGAKLGFYSLRGFTEAYKALGHLCPDGSETRSDPQPIAISNIRAAKGPSPYSEFIITGPFIQSPGSDRITIRAVPSEFADIDGYMDKENFSPPGIFTYGSQRLEFYHDGALIDVVDGGSHTNRMQGACLDPESGRLKIVFHSWDGGASDPGQTSVLYYDPSVGIVSQEVANVEDGVSLLHCSEDESSWQWGGNFLPCQCVGRSIEDAYSTAMDGVSSEIDRLDQNVHDALTHIDKGTFSSLLSRITRLEPFTQWDVHSSLDVRRLESSKFTVVVITKLDHADYFRHAQTTYVRRRTDDFWVPIYSAKGTSKTFNTVTIHAFVDDENLDMDICVEECDSGGRHDRLTRNVAQWQQVALNGSGWYKEGYFESGTLEEVKACLDAGVDAKTPYTSGVTPLHRAARYSGNPDVIKALIDAGADTKARDDEKSTPLHWAAENDEPHVISVLLKAGADLEARDQQGSTPLHLAACCNRRNGVVEVLLDAGADLNARDKFENTPLHDAAARSTYDSRVSLLIEAGANLATRNRRGKTPLDLAVERNDKPEVAKVLRAAGAPRSNTETQIGEE